MNPFETWEQHHITTTEPLITQLKAENPKVLLFDTETTGLHIKKDKPFLMQVGWTRKGAGNGVVYTFYAEDKDIMRIFFYYAKKCDYVIAANINYDLSMLCNIGWEDQVFNWGILWLDMQTIARLSLEAVPVREGGQSLKLKDLGVTFIHPDAANSEKLIKEELKKLKQVATKVLTAALKQFDHPTERNFYPFRLDTGKKTTSTYARDNESNVEWRYVPAKWNKKLIEDFMKDPTHDLEDLPEDVREVWVEWKQDYADPTYADIDRDLLIQYAAEDIITMGEVCRKFFPFVLRREQLPVLQREMKIIIPALAMEREGMKVDQEYLEQARLRVKNYIKKKRKILYDVAGEVVNCGQHERIKQIFSKKFGMTLEASDAQALTHIKKREIEGASEMAALIMELRTLEKWYSTYILRIQKNAEYDGKVYTQLNMSSAVSGRMSSDLQQFPKKPIKDDKGNELFEARRAFVVDKVSYNFLLMVDYSQVELRCMADYTLKVAGGDLNLCRAYMPLRCKHYLTGEEYQFKTFEERQRWSELKEGHPNPRDFKEGLADVLKLGWSVWVKEDGEPWSPTDVHGETTRNTLLAIEYEEQDVYKLYTSTQNVNFGETIDAVRFKQLRSEIGKPFNFSKNYGVGMKTTIEQLGVSEEVAQALFEGYDRAFPGIAKYNEAVERAHHQLGYVDNYVGRRYYMQDFSKSYKLGNHIIQGGCADLMKQAIIDLYFYMQEHKLKSKLILPVHDKTLSC